MNHYHDKGARSEKEGLLDKGTPEAATLIRQGTCRTEYFDQRNDAKEEVDDPNDAVAHKPGTYGLHKK